MTDFLRSARRIGNWTRLGHEREPEVEVEDVRRAAGAARAPTTASPASEQDRPALERPVGLGVERVAVEDDELRVDCRADGAPARSPRARPRCSPGSGRRVTAQPSSMPSSASCSRRRAFSAFSIDRMVRPIVAPSYDPDLRVHEDLQPRKAAAAELLVRAARAPVLIRVRAVRRRIEVRLGVDVDRPRDRLRHVFGARVVPRDDRVEALVELDVAGARRAGRPRGRARGVARSRRLPRSSRGCRRPTRS